MRKISPKLHTTILAILFILSLSLFIFSIFPKKRIEKASSITYINKEIPISPIQEKSIKNNPIVTNTGVGKIQTQTITLVAGEINRKLEFTSGQTLYEILLTESSKNLLEFKGKEHTGIGFFVTDIGTLHQDNGRYLMYYINGIEASYGVSKYVPESGDIIEWKLK
jgi:hypothetical protein